MLILKQKKVVPYLYSFAERRNILLSICSNTFNYNEEKNFIRFDTWQQLGTARAQK